MPQLSTATLALINQAETDLATAQAADGTAAQAVATAADAQTAATNAQSAALQAHTTATSSALVALSALESELGIPSETQIPPTPPASPPASPSEHGPSMKSMRPGIRQNATIQRALNLGIDYSQILNLLLKGGMTLLEQAIQNAIGQMV